jgi:poly(glycerol-phosphate) alpha-glucosyltransferase
VAERETRVAERVSSPAALSVLFAAGNLSLENAGPYLALQQTVRALEHRGHRVTVLGSRRKDDDPSVRWTAGTQAFRMYGPPSLHFAPGLSRWLNRRPVEWDVVSMQSVWLHTNRVVADWCIRHGKPFMMTTRGNFNPVALKISAWKKWLALHSFMTPVFKHVTCYQALNESEYRALRNYGIRQPICVIGNGIDLPDMGGLPAPDGILPKNLQGRRTCLYLGRLHPIKGIDLLLRAWGRVRPSDEWQLVIAGDGTASFRAELETVVRQSHCRNVHFVGAVAGDIKSAWFRRADLFVLPSKSEGFPMALNEAFSYGTPALITTTCGFPESAEAGIALEVESSDDGVAAGLEEILQLSPERLRCMGAAARFFVGERYAWSGICSQLEAVYAWMRAERPPPLCLRLN